MRRRSTTMRTACRGLLLGAAGLAGVAMAQAPLTPPETAGADRAAPPLWEAGVLGLGVSQQAYPGARDHVGRGLVVPWLIWRGPLLRADEETVGLRALRGGGWTLDIGVAGAFGSRADEVPARAGMPDIGTLVEFGPRLVRRARPGERGGWRVELPLRAVLDLDDGLARRGLTFEPRVVYGWRAAGWGLSASAGALLGDRRLGETFYGVSPAFATPGRPAYEADGGLVAWRLGLSASRPLSADWRLFGFTRLDSVAGAANRDSPLVQRTAGASAGIGLSWTFGRSSRPGAE